MSRRLSCSLAGALAGALAVCGTAGAGEPAAGKAAEEEKLAKQLSNPIASLVSVPLQFNWENGVGSRQDLRFVLNFQPVVPIRLNDDWTMIGRFIVPFQNQPAEIVPGSPTASGTGDILASTFFSRRTSGLSWGVGPVLGLPTTTDPLLGSGQWSIGPTAVALKQSGPWTVGALVNHLWSIADTGGLERADVSQTLLQPFLAFSTRNAVTFSLNTESTRNGKAESGNRWTVPINAGVSKVTRFGPFPFSIGAGGGYFIERPAGGPQWKLRLTYTLIFPRGKEQGAPGDAGPEGRKQP